jgi:hypothetical protein
MVFATYLAGVSTRARRAQQAIEMQRDGVRHP